MKIPVVTVLALLLTLVKATKVEIDQEWKPDYGWEVTCAWQLDMNDTLQSINLSKNKQQFFVIRPEYQHGKLLKSNRWDLVESIIKVDCIEAVDSGIKGKCVMTVEPLVPPRRDFTFGCEVSGERPYFRMDSKEVTVEALVPPSQPVMKAIQPESGPVTLNCTTSGLPAPSIIWTVNDQKIPHDFHGSPVWNATSKLWDVWSSYTPPPDVLYQVQCTPETQKGFQHVRGLSSQYNDAYRIFLDGTLLIIGAVATLFL